jgi:hypothetical protein
VATASHELRTPLTMLQGTMELLEEDLATAARHADAQRQVATRGASCAALDARRASCSTSRGSTPRSRCAPRPSSSASWRAPSRPSSGCAPASWRPRSRSCRPMARAGAAVTRTRSPAWCGS